MKKRYNNYSTNKKKNSKHIFFAFKKLPDLETTILLLKGLKLYNLSEIKIFCSAFNNLKSFVLGSCQILFEL